MMNTLTDRQEKWVLDTTRQRLGNKVAYHPWIFLETAAALRSNIMTPCDNECGWEEPYGFVPEAGCDVHDKTEQEQPK